MLIFDVFVTQFGKVAAFNVHRPFGELLSVVSRLVNNAFTLFALFL